MATWVDKAAEQLVRECKKQGIEKYDYDQVKIVLAKEAEVDRPKESKDRWGFAYIHDEYTELAKKRFMDKVQSFWSSTEPKAPPPIPPVITSSAPMQTDVPHMSAVLSVAVDERADLSDLSVVKNKFNTYLKQGNFSAEVADISSLQKNWVDLKINFRGPLAKIYEHIFNHDDVADVVTKPVADFGVESEIYSK